ncbi:MAG: type VI secretion system protein ImpH [Lentisphaeria bacterium]|jgi:type VI secretion system protein ImpH
MPSKSRREGFSVVDKLLKNPHEFSFIQVVRLLERASALQNYIASEDSASTEVLANPGNAKQQTNYRKLTSGKIAKFSPPLKEALRFVSTHSLRFPESEVSSIIKKPISKDESRWQIIVNFLGLTGAMGVMPFHYTEMILQQLKLKDKSLANFLDMFNHRTTSLFFQASTKYRLPIEYERSQLNKQKSNGDSQHTKALLSLLGLGTAHLRNRQYFKDESLIYFSGLYSQQVKSASNLSQIINHYFGVPINIEGFIGQWQDLIDDVRARLPDRQNRMGQNVCLGRSTMLGKKGWFAQGKSRIKIGPLNKEQYNKFAPGTDSLKALNEIVKSYIGMEQDYDFVIQVKRADVPNKIKLCKDNPPMMAWNTWLSGKPKTNTDKDDVLEIVTSSKNM